MQIFFSIKIIHRGFPSMFDKENNFQRVIHPTCLKHFGFVPSEVIRYYLGIHRQRNKFHPPIIIFLLYYS